MVANDEYVMSNSLRSTLQRHSRNMENRESFTEMEELRRHRSEQRVLSTTPTEGVDSPSPTSTLPFDMRITTRQLQSSGVVVGASMSSLRSTPINEMLYEPLRDEQKECHLYDQVRPDSHASRVSSNARLHPHHAQSPPPRIEAYATTSVASVAKQPEPYQTPELSRLSDSPQFPVRGSSMGLSMTLPKTADHSYPQPYQQPSVQGRRTSVPARATSRGLLHTNAFVTSQDSIRPAPSQIAPSIEEDRATVVGSDVNSSLAWYNTFADSDNGVPPGLAQGDITPYASIPNSQIRATPYQQPVWTSASQFSLTSNSTSGIRTIQV